MSKKQKLIEKVLSFNTDISVDELTVFLSYFGYKLSNKGKTSGSRIVFISKTGHKIYFHKPHPGNIVKKAYITEMILSLKLEGLI